MNRVKTNIIMERFLIKNAIKLEKERQESEPYYSKYHEGLANDYYNILSDLEDFVGYDSSKQDEDFTEFIFKSKFDPDKPEDSFRKKYGNAAYLRALGDTASYYYGNKINEVIESILLPENPENSALESLYYDGIYPYDEPFKCKSIPVIDLINPKQLEFSLTKLTTGYEVRLIKPVEQLEFEQVYLLNAFKKLSDQAKDEDTKKTYKRYGLYALYIYEYYISISSGKQLITPRLSNSNLKTIDSNSKYSKERQLIEISKKNGELLDFFKEIQKQNPEFVDNKKVFKM